ncbi:MAG: Sua5/YciO/YrdC/YwlC family protein [Saprospiraceae bacterium]|nr:Sua5/YciO/YrdC/YwlC family protein [Saprospiraceae bacterium]
MTTYTNEKIRMVQEYDIKGALAILRNGGVILYPTDTIWSIGCDATNPQAVEKVHNIKQRTTARSFEILVDSIQMLKDYVEHLHPKIETLLLYHMRPLTVVFDRPRNLPSNATFPDGAAAIRLVQDEFCRSLIAEHGKPLLASFASVGDLTFPINFGAISSEIIEGVDFVVKYRQNEKSTNEPAVMVKLSKRDELIFLRE